MRRRGRDAEAPLDPEIERDLEIVDRVLAGEAVSGSEAEESWADVTTLIRAERPAVDPEWAEALDEWARQGFPRSRRSPANEVMRARGIQLGWLSRLSDRLPRRAGPLAGAVASLAIIAVVAVSTLGEGPGQEAQLDDQAPMATTSDGGAAEQAAEVAPLGPGAAMNALRRESSEALAPGDVDDVGIGGGIEGAATQPRIAPGTANRRVDRDASITIAARPDEVRSTSDEVISIARSLGAIVASSQVSESGGSATAQLDLQVPTRNLDAAIGRLTEIGEIDSLNESSIDITKPYVSAKDRLEDARSARDSLLEALAKATTDEEAEAIRAQIKDARREISRAEARFENVARQARWSSLAVVIRSDAGIDEDRTLIDWLEDAADVLQAVAGVLLISAAILLPIALVVAIVWVAVSGLRRRRRERALDD